MCIAMLVMARTALVGPLRTELKQGQTVGAAHLLDPFT